jgi:RND family efflux transporter MFP subunit
VEIKRAGLKLAEATLIRKENAFKDRAVSEVDVIQARAEKAQAEAAIHGAEAAVETARIKLGYTRIQAPIDGVISRNLVDVGNLAGAGEATLLTSIIDDDPMFVYFSISDSDLLYYRQAAREDKAPRDKRGGAKVYLGLVNEKGYPHQGYGDFVNNTVDPKTGTILVRAVFPNSDHVLAPGLFVRLRIPVSKQKNALLVPESALGADQSGRYLLVVDEHDIVQYRKVTLGVREKGMREVTEGLKAGERVVIKGLQRARPGIKVTPQTPEQAGAADKAAKQQGDKSKSQAKTK